MHSWKKRKAPTADNRAPESSLGMALRFQMQMMSFKARPSGAPSHRQRKGKAFITKRPHSRHNSEQVDESSDDEPTFSGPIAAEFERLRDEVDSLKEALYESKKLHKRQTKVHILHTKTRSVF
jgi:hypothetical protein